MDTRSFLMLLVLFLGGCTGQTCKGKCVCNTQTVNGTAIVINLQNYFTYPINGTRDLTPGNEKFTFSFSPCQPMSCYPGRNKTAAVCQYNNLPGKEDQAVSLGAVSDLQWMAVTDEQNFEILITGGDKTFTVPSYSRHTAVTFKYNPFVLTNTLTYLGEVTTADVIVFNFEVMVADPEKPFQHSDPKSSRNQDHFVNGTRDTTPGNEKYTYSFSPCQPMSCYPGRNKTAAVCQYNNLPGKEDQAVSLGAVSDLQWMAVTDERNFEILITGGDKTFTNPSKQRHTTVTFKYNPFVLTNTITYLGEVTTADAIVFNFEVMVADPEKPFQHSDPKSSRNQDHL